MEPEEAARAVASATVTGSGNTSSGASGAGSQTNSKLNVLQICHPSRHQSSLFGVPTLLVLLLVVLVARLQGFRPGLSFHCHWR